MQADLVLTQRIIERARELGVDLVGVANVERYEHAPVLMSPQGHFPQARCIVVVALHHTDGAIEMGGRPTPHDIGPYSVQNTMNTRNEHIVWCLAGMLEGEGWRAIPMPATNIWRFRPYDGVDRPFVPDISNIHAAAAAGLGEIGWSGLLLTPEFGPRQRFCTLITDAPLAPTPLYRGPALCDRCMMCAEHCLAEAFDKEVRGECVVVIEDKEMRYADKNMWRCAWGEHFGLDLFLDKPDHIDEAVIREYLARHGRRGGEMGSCLRFCLPPHLRHFDPDYTDTVRRRLNTSRPELPVDRPATWEVRRIAAKWGAAAVAVATPEECGAVGIDLGAKLTDGQRLVAFAVPWPNGCSSRDAEAVPLPAASAAARDFAAFAEHDIARQLERLGYAAIPRTGIGPQTLAGATRIGDVASDRAVHVRGHGPRVVLGSVITSAPIEPGVWPAPERPAARLWPLIEALQGGRAARASLAAETDRCRAVAAERLFSELPGRVDMIGFAAAEALDDVVEQLEGLLDLGAMARYAVDRGPIHGPVVPEIVERERPILRRPRDWLEGARSVVVLGARIPATTLDRATEPPADAVGPYAYAVYQARRELRYAALWIGLALEAAGFRAAITDDLMGTGSVQINPRGHQPDFRASRFAAVAAGLGRLMHTGGVWTPEHGPRCLFIAIVTDASLEPAPPLAGPSPCETCEAKPCVSACPTGALLGELVEVEVCGQRERFGRLDWLRCEWAKHYGLVGDAGPRWIGSQTDIAPPLGKLTIEQVAEAYAQLDPVQKHWMCIVEPCLRACHLQTLRR